MAGDPRETPAMQQYYRFKRAHPGCVLLFRVGDFFETFDDDAVTISKALGLTLTKRTEGVPMAGVPHHQLENYLRRLLAQGFRVAVADQVEDAAQAKGLVRREVTRVATPGTIVEEGLLDDDAGNALAAICFLDQGEQAQAAFAITEASTGEFTVGDAAGSALADELARRRVREIIYPEAGLSPPPRVLRLAESLGLSATPRPVWHFRREESLEAILSHFSVRTLAGFGLRDDDPSIPAAGALLRYLRETQTPASTLDADKPDPARPSLAPRGTLAHLRPPRREDRRNACIVDAVSLRALEVERVLRQASSPTQIDRSLVGLFLAPGSRCVARTPMGKRLLRDWLVRPLADLDAIRARHDAVAVLVSDRRAAAELADQLEGVQDVARIAGRLALDRATPRDLVALGKSLGRAASIAHPLANAPALAGHRARLAAADAALAPLAADIARACVDDPPAHLREGGLFRDGFDPELDEARLLQRDAGRWLADYQDRLAREANLPGIKVGFNRVFGYYIELSAAQAKLAPASLTRKQTLKNAERYTTPELREFESKVLSAESRAFDRERALFQRFADRARAHLPAIQAFADVVAELDALSGFAQHAAAKGWTRPEMTDRPVLVISQGRHPVLEDLLAADFVPNDTALGSPDHAPLALITGPNMAGKSTYIRQVALIVLLAHAGSFVPASHALVGLTDRIFTRIGADDALHAGQSTFMVEMTETANILNNASDASLVVLDEIGRGTSTLDGLSLAWAITEHLTSAPRPRTLFATHYHELTSLQDLAPQSVQNLHVAVREWTTPEGSHEIVFLHRILPGRTDQSYGVHVARLAGIPANVVARARELLRTLAVHNTTTAPPHAAIPASQGKHAKARSQPEQLPLFSEYLPHPAVEALREIKLDTLSPIQAFDTLRRLREMLEQPPDTPT
jgi:DNA mismatch repair protein MutS